MPKKPTLSELTDRRFEDLQHHQRGSEFSSEFNRVGRQMEYWEQHGVPYEVVMEVREVVKVIPNLDSVISDPEPAWHGIRTPQPNMPTDLCPICYPNGKENTDG